MLVMRKALAVLAAFLAAALPASTTLGRGKLVTTNHETAQTATAAEVAELQNRLAALESQLNQGMASGYEGQAYDAQGMPGPYLPGGPAYGGGACGGGACGSVAPGGCGCGPAYGGGACGGNCCCCCPCDQWYVGGGVYGVRPHWNTNPAFATFSTVGGVDTRSQTDFDYDLDAAPFARVGYRSCSGLGIEGRGWWYDDSDSNSVVNPGGTAIVSAAPLGLGLVSTTAGDALTFDSSLKIDVIDLVLTYQMPFECGSLEFGAGARYARIKQTYRAAEILALPQVFTVASIDSSHRFEGAGPSFSVEGRLNATRRLSFFGTARYSLLFGGDAESATVSFDNVLDTQAHQENDQVLAIAELDLGAEYAIRIGCSELYISAAFVSQFWQGAGNSANNDPITDTRGVFADKNADLGLWGFRAEVGARF